MNDTKIWLGSKYWGRVFNCSHEDHLRENGGKKIWHKQSGILDCPQFLDNANKPITQYLRHAFSNSHDEDENDEMTKITHSTSQGCLSQKTYSTLFGVAIYANTITSPTLHRSVQKNTLTNCNHLSYHNTFASPNPEDCGNSKFLSSSIFWASMSWRRGGWQKGNGPERDVWSVTDHDPCGGEVAVDQDTRVQQERDSVPTKWSWQLLHRETLAFTKKRQVLKDINNAQTQEGQVSRLIYWDEFSVVNDFLTTVKLPSLGFWSKSWHRDKFLAKKWLSME